MPGFSELEKVTHTERGGMRTDPVHWNWVVCVPMFACMGTESYMWR